MSAWLQRLSGHSLGLLGRNTLLGATGLGIRAVIQIVYLLMVSRWLGAAGYGLFAGSVALVAIASPLANWGSRYLIIQHVAKAPQQSRAIWATALVQTSVTGILLAAITLFVAGAFLPERLPIGPLALLACAELMLLPASHAASSQCQALERGAWAALSTCLIPAARTSIMLMTIAIGVDAAPSAAALAHFGGSLLGLAGGYLLVNHVNGGPPSWSQRLPLPESTRQGASFALSNAAASSYQEIDKVLMLQILGAMVVGPYTVAFRIAAVFTLPINAMISATLPRLVSQHGHQAFSNTYKTMLQVGLTYGALASIAMFVSASTLTMFFGEDYIEARHYLEVLSVWPALFALRNCIAANLTAAGKQHARTLVEVSGFALVLTLNLLFIPIIGANAAIWSLLITEALMATSMTMLSKRS